MQEKVKELQEKILSETIPKMLYSKTVITTYAVTIFIILLIMFLSLF